jgi:hypothetical protein
MLLLLLLPQYKSDTELAEGLKHGRYHQGVFYINRSNLMEGYVSAEGYDEDILIQVSIFSEYTADPMVEMAANCCFNHASLLHANREESTQTER